MRHAPTLRSVSLALVSFLVLPRATSAQQAPPDVGDTAPPIRLAGVVDGGLAQTPADGGLTVETQGHVTVLDFWATWCSPCYPALDHLAELKKRFEGEPVVFLAITDEDEAQVQRFLERKPLDIPIGLDTSGAVFDAYQPSPLSHAVIIDQQGKIAAITYPEEVTAEALSDVLAGKAIDLPRKESGVRDLADVVGEADSSSLVRAMLRPSGSDVTRMTMERNRILANGLWPINIIEQVYRTPPGQIVDEVPLPKSTFALDVAVPVGSEDLLLPLAQQVAEAGFAIDVDRETRTMPAVVLRQIEGEPLKLEEAKNGTGGPNAMSGTSVTASNAPLDVLARFIGLTYPELPVVDETSLTGRYNYAIDLVVAGKAALKEELAKLGLELLEEERPVDVLVVRPASDE